jgi:hypothetical protein
VFSDVCAGRLLKSTRYTPPAFSLSHVPFLYGTTLLGHPSDRNSENNSVISFHLAVLSLQTKIGSENVRKKCFLNMFVLLLSWPRHRIGKVEA